MQLPHIPFEVILAVLFFVLPAVGNLLSKRKEGARGEKRAEPTSQPSEARPARPSPEATTLPTSPASPTASTTASTTGDWLEQARRRVAEAQGREAAGRGSAPSSPPLVKPRQLQPQQPKPQQGTANRTATPARPPHQRTRPSLEGRGLEGRSLETRQPDVRRPEARSLEGASLEGRSAERGRERYTSLETSSLGDSLMAEAPPIRVQRLNPSKRATITGQELRFDAHDIAKGLIWHQVLSPPRSTLRRTRLSRRQR